jgi:hypothetical protein
MVMTDVSPEAADVAKKAISSSSLIAHIVERRLEYLIGSLIAYQMGILDSLVSAGQSCIA